MCLQVEVTHFAVIVITNNNTNPPVIIIDNIFSVLNYHCLACKVRNIPLLPHLVMYSP
jgi:hypothetical protein